MAGKNTDGNGKGSSKVALSSEEQDAVRRNKKKHNRRHTGTGKIMDVIAGQTLFDGIREDCAAQKVEQDMFYRHQFFANVWGHINRYATNRSWSVVEIDEAHSYLRTLIFESEQFTCSSEKVQDEVRRRFALGCSQNHRMRGMPGQRKNWYTEALNSAKEFKASRKAQPRQLQPA